MYNHLIDLQVAQELVQRPQIAAGIRTYRHLMAWQKTAIISADFQFQDEFAKFYRMKRFRSASFL